MEEDEFIKRKSNCTIFLGYTSNMVSAGVRESIRFLVQHKMVKSCASVAKYFYYYFNIFDNSSIDFTFEALKQFIYYTCMLKMVKRETNLEALEIISR